MGCDQLLIAGFIVGLVLLLAGLLMWPLPEVPGQGVAGDFLVRNVTVVDVEAGVCERIRTLSSLTGESLAHIGNTRQIEGLFFNGQYFERVALDQLLEFAEHQAGSIRTNLHLLWQAINSTIVRMQLDDLLFFNML